MKILSYLYLISLGIFLLLSSVLPVFPAIAVAQNGAAQQPAAVQPINVQSQQNQQDSSTKFAPLTQLPGLEEISSSNSLSGLLNQLYRILIGVAAVGAVIMIMVAGVEIMVSRGSVASNEKAKSHLQGAVLGLLLVLSPAIVFGIINPDILKLDFNVSRLTPSYQPIDIEAIRAAGQQNRCDVYTDIKPITVRGAEQGSCEAGFERVQSSCCNTTLTTEICCARVAQRQHVLAYTFKQTPKQGTQGNVCIKPGGPTYFAEEAKCRQSASALNTFISSGAANYTYSELKVLKNCELVSNIGYKIPDEPNMCK